MSREPVASSLSPSGFGNPEFAPFLQQIWERPNDDGSRLIFADYLDDNRDPLGTFIRVQCALARITEDDPRWVELKKKEKALLCEYGDAWTHPIKQKLGDACSEIIFFRGLPNSLVLPGLPSFLLSNVLKSYPITHLKIENLQVDDLPLFVKFLDGTAITSLDLSDNDLGPAGAERIANMTNLKSLDVEGNNLGPEGAAHIATMINLKSLNMRNNFLGPTGAEHIAKLTSLNILNVNWNFLGSAGAEHIAKMNNLKSLDVEGNSLEPEGAAHVAKMINLKSLNVRNNFLGPTGAEHIAKMTNLKSLDASENELMPAGAEHIAKMTNLKSLNMRNNFLGAAGTELIAKMTNLKFLSVDSNHLSEQEMQRIVDSSDFASTLVALNGRPYASNRWQRSVRNSDKPNDLKI